MNEFKNSLPENNETTLLDENQVHKALVKENKINQTDKIKINHNDIEGTINVIVNDGANAFILAFDGKTLYDLNEIKSITEFENKANQHGYITNKLQNGFLEISQINKHDKPTKLKIGGSEYMTALSSIMFSNERINAINLVQLNNGEKVENKDLDLMIQQNVLKPIDILILKEKGAIDDNQGKKYLDETIGYMLTNMVEGRMNNVKAPNNEIVKTLNGKEYKIKQSEFTIEELDYYKDSGLIGNEEYEIHRDFIIEMNEIDEEIKKSIGKDIIETKKKLASLEIKSN